ncbi:hypothetical protein GCM10010341_67860 [Streptomyces noursei]|nr:hypothetical protein GCM10010341_67860 [Streptomyces noursei]
MTIPILVFYGTARAKRMSAANPMAPVIASHFEILPVHVPRTSVRGLRPLGEPAARFHGR